MHKKFPILLVLIMLALTPVSVARAQTGSDGPFPPPVPNSEEAKQVLPELGKNEQGPTPGEGDYKVFGPDAIKSVTVETAGKALMPSTVYRAGWTDVYRDGDRVNGSHNSQSDLYEDSIHAEGSLQETGLGIINGCNEGPRPGSFASCTTSLPRYECWDLMFVYKGHSWHYFHKSGYVDNRFETGETVMCP